MTKPVATVNWTVENNRGKNKPIYLDPGAILDQYLQRSAAGPVGELAAATNRKTGSDSTIATLVFLNS